MTEELKRRWGRVEPETTRWWKRYNRLRDEGFCHDEATVIAEGIIGSKAMRKGRAARRRWYKTVAPLGLSDDELAARIDEMYDTEDWRDQYSQFYPEEE